MLIICYKYFVRGTQIWVDEWGGKGGRGGEERETGPGPTGKNTFYTINRLAALALLETKGRESETIL